MPAEVETMFYSLDRGVPWHKAGVATPGAVTSEEAIKLAGLDWEVELTNIFGPDGHVIDKFVGVTRKTDQRVLGVVRPGRYQPTQNRAVFAWMDSLVEDRVVLYDTAGSLFGGAKIWLLALIPSELKIADDEYKEYLLASTSHDGSASTSLWNTSIRVVCANTFAIATAASALARVRHARTAAAEMAETRGLFNASRAEQIRLNQWLETLTTAKVEEGDALALRNGLLGEVADDLPTIKFNSIEKWDGIFNEEVARNGLTGYSLFNTVTGYADHGLRFKGGGEARFASILQGRASEFKRDGIIRIEELTGIRQKDIAVV